MQRTLLFMETDYSPGIAQMNVFFLQRKGIDLYQKLHTSETSRNILRFYHPKEVSGGVTIPIDSLVSGLSIAGELRWYIRRYMQDVLFEFPLKKFCTLALARQIYYDREVKPGTDWPFKRLYIIRRGCLISAQPIAQGAEYDDMPVISPDITRLFVWITEEEYLIPPRSTRNSEEEVEVEP